MAASLALGACTAVPFEDTPPEPRTELALSGTYAVRGVWDLGGVFTDRPTVGEIVADDLIERLIDLLGVPSQLRDQARDVIAGAVREPVRDAVDSRLPAELAPDSPLMADLAEIFGVLEVDAALSLTAGGGDDPNAVAGLERITAIRAVRDAAVHEVPIDEVAADGVTIAADVSGQITGREAAALDPHELQVRLGTLVVMVGDLALSVDVEAATAAARDAIACADVTARITGGGATFDIRVAGESFSIGAGSVTDGCEAARDAMTDQLLGFVRRDTGVVLGGPIAFADDDGDLRVDRLAGGPGYAGEIASVPGPFQPVFGVSFTAARQ